MLHCLDQSSTVLSINLCSSFSNSTFVICTDIPQLFVGNVQLYIPSQFRALYWEHEKFGFIHHWWYIQSMVPKVTIAETETTATAVPECEKTVVLCEIASTSCKARLPQSDEKCWNCDHLMEPEHLCEKSSSSSSNTVSNVNETGISGMNYTPPGSPIQRRIICPKKFYDFQCSELLPWVVFPLHGFFSPVFLHSTSRLFRAAQ